MEGWEGEPVGLGWLVFTCWTLAAGGRGVRIRHMSAQNRSRRRLGALVVTSSLVLSGPPRSRPHRPRRLVRRGHQRGVRRRRQQRRAVHQRLHRADQQRQLAPVDLTGWSRPVRLGRRHHLAADDADRQHRRRAALPRPGGAGGGNGHAAADPRRDRQRSRCPPPPARSRWSPADRADLWRRLRTADRRASTSSATARANDFETSPAPGTVEHDLGRPHGRRRKDTDNNARRLRRRRTRSPRAR